MLQTIEISLPELLERVRLGQIPMSARAQVTYDAALAAPSPEPTPDAPSDEATPEEELEAERRLFEQFEKNVNETRAACGMRTL